MQKNTTHLAGEFLVAGELSRRGYPVSITMGNAKSVDIYAESKNEIIKYRVKGIGVASSCRIRIENGAEYLYVVEIKKPDSKKYDGRGVVSFPVSEL